MCKVQITRNGKSPFHFIVNTDNIFLDNSADEFNFGDNIEVEGEIVDGGKLFNVNAVIKCQKFFHCDRCLKPSVDNQIINLSEEIERSEITDDVIDLTEMIRDNIVAAQPIQNLCKPDCKGLCPKCGVNLNDSSCNCERLVINPKFEVLKNMFDKRDEEE